MAGNPSPASHRSISDLVCLPREPSAHWDLISQREVWWPGTCSLSTEMQGRDEQWPLMHTNQCCVQLMGLMRAISTWAGKPYFQESIRMLPNGVRVSCPGPEEGPKTVFSSLWEFLLGKRVQSQTRSEMVQNRGKIPHTSTQSRTGSPRSWDVQSDMPLALKVELTTRCIILMSSRVWLRGEWKEFLKKCRQPLSWQESLRPHTSGQHGLLSGCISHWKEEARMKGTFPCH